MTKAEIRAKWGTEIDALIEGEELLSDVERELSFDLYEYFFPQMPYGVAKARDGDPDRFIWDHITELEE